ncbi:hypothetical protein [Microbacterium sp. 2FI]|uniref:hypothetical protein n=1 Tax=Microbacterium sp. 2FI TaxID=2502193 RepID=UPI0020169221|nr:hypothetical protein [Microbacterium sp. 2FI]
MSDPAAPNSAAPVPVPVPADQASAAPPSWAAPGAPAFGAPVGPSPAGAAVRSPVYAPPVGYPAPGGSHGGSYGAGAPGTYGAVTPPASTGNRLGVVALLLSLVATLGAPVVAALAAFRIGLGAGREIALNPVDISLDWSVLTPVRDWVLLAEAAFWVGTVLGIWAIVQGIAAIVQRRGRGAGAAAVIIAVLGPIVFAVAVQIALASGGLAGSGLGG